MHTGHHRGHLTRAVMEGVVFALRDSLELMRRLRVDATEAVAVGGGARSPFWRRMQADALGVPVVTVGPQGGAPYGAAILAAVGSGAFASVQEACRAWIRPLDRIEPDPESHRRLRRSLPALPQPLPPPQAPLRRADPGRTPLNEPVTSPVPPPWSETPRRARRPYMRRHTPR